MECHGRLVPRAAGHDLTLNFIGKAIALEDELRDALAVQSAAAARFWRDLRPRGLMNVDAELHYAAGQRKPDLWVTLEPLSDSREHAPFPSADLLSHKAGKSCAACSSIIKGRVTLEKVRAEHRTTRLAAEGECLLDGEGGWRLHFERLEVDRLKADRDLMQALNGGLEKGGHRLAAARADEPARQARPGQQRPIGLGALGQWNVGIEGHQVAIDCGVALENIFGGSAALGIVRRQEVRVPTAS